MLKEIKGNLLNACEDVIAHQVNCKGVMGAGVAKQIKQNLMTTDSFSEYCNLCKTMSANVLLGSNHWCKAYNGKDIVNMFGEDIPTGKKLDTNYNALNSCLLLLMKKAKEHSKSIALPGYLGCGLAGGDWNLVYDMIKNNYNALNSCLLLLMKKAKEHSKSIALPGYLGCGLAGGDWNLVYDMIKNAAETHGIDVTIYYLPSSVKMLWEDFGDVPMDPETECIEEKWHGFEAGTHREEIWSWFEETFHASVAELMGLTPKVLPSLEEIRADYKSFRELTKDVKTLEDLKKLRHQFVIEINGVSISEFEEMPTEIEWVRYDGYGCLEDIYDYFDGKPKLRHQFVIEINGVSISEFEEMPTEIEWVRYDGYGCLEDIYDYFDGKPKFQINCKEHDELRYLVIGAITEDDVTEENYKRWQDWISK